MNNNLDRLGVIIGLQGQSIIDLLRHTEPLVGRGHEGLIAEESN